METIVQFFETIPASYRTLALSLGLIFFWTLEGLIPLFSFSYRKWRHAGMNLFLTLLQFAVGLTFASLIIWAADYTVANQFGLLYLVDLPLWLHVILGIFLLDLIGAWLIHWVEHHVRWMWKIHLIHHTDTTIDVTSGLRHHPGETILRSSFGLLAVLIAGVPIGVFFIYQTLSILFAQITHANVRSHLRVDEILSWIFVTPNMHKVHHHYKQPLTDTNYGNIFSIWDRMFGTFARVGNPADLTYGIDTHMSPEDYGSVWNLLTIPFQKYRAPDGSKFSDETSEKPASL